MPAATEQPRPAMEAPPHVDATGAVVDGAVLPRQEEAEAGAAGGGGRERCPRCASRDTKFCYYNNYNTAQPRHFCRACRRYWTLGGSLRDVPVGGSLRKRPRRPARPTRALAAAAAAAVVTTTARTTTTTSPFASSSSPAVLAPASDSSSLFGSLFGTAPLLEGRLGFGLGLGHPGATEMGPFRFGGAEAPLLWSSMILEGDHADTWRAAVEVSSQVAACQELAAAAAPVEEGGLHHGTQPLL